MLWEMFERGGIVMWPLLGASVFGFALILDRCLVFLWWYQRFQPVADALQPLILGRRWSEAVQWCRRRGPFTSLARVYVEHRDKPEAFRDRAAQRQGTLALAVLEKRLRWLAALAQVSTLLGLLGTFYFMIYRFRPEATASGHIPQAEFYAAIWESFLSTMFGLIIAIPCTLVFQVLESRVDAVARDLEILASLLKEWEELAAGPNTIKEPGQS